MSLYRRRVLLFILLGALSAVGTTWAHAESKHLLGERGLATARRVHEALSLLERTAPRDSQLDGSPRVLSINGATVRLQSAWLGKKPAFVRSLLQAARSDCHTPLTPEQGARQRSLLRAPLLEQELPREGFVFCLKPQTTLTRAGLSSLADALTSTGDLSSLGRFQGIYVREGERSNLVLTVEILSGLVPERMFPMSGDSPGTDIVTLPRPPGRRVLSVSYHGAIALTNYRAATEPIAALAEYEGMLRSQGTTVRRASDDASALFVQRHNEAFLVSASESTGGALLMIARLPN